jgi:hypothetical protein
MDDKKKNWIISVGLNLTIIVFPFLISLVYHEPIQEKTLTLAIAMFLLSVGMTSTEKLFFYGFLIVSLFLLATYGAIDNKSVVQSFGYYQIWFGIAGFIVLILDKYDLHVRKGQPLNNF